MKSKRSKHTPSVTIRERAEQSVRVEFSFPDGKGGLVEFFFAVYPDGRTEPRVTLYRMDDGIRIYHPLPAHDSYSGGLTRKDPNA